MPWTCCELRSAIRLRDMNIIGVIKSMLKETNCQGNFGIFRAIREDHDECASAILGYFPTMMKALKGFLQNSKPSLVRRLAYNSRLASINYILS